MVMSIDKKQELEKLVKNFVRELLVILGEDKRDSTKDTPERVARAFVDEFLRGYFEDPKQYLKTFTIGEGIESNKHSEYSKIGDIVLVTNIPLKTLCEHHLLPIIGEVHIAYIPRERVLGLSKFARIVDAYARRLQMQERLTDQIADFIYRELSSRGVLVVIDAIHLCTFIRGVNEPLRMITMSFRGEFDFDKDLRREVLAMISQNIATNPVFGYIQTIVKRHIDKA